MQEERNFYLNGSPENQPLRQDRKWKRCFFVVSAILVAVVVAGAMFIPAALDEQYNKGYQAGKEYAAEEPSVSTGILDRIEEEAEQERIHDKANELINYTPVSFANGELIQYPQAAMLCPLSVEVAGPEAYYIFLDSTTNSDNDMAFMVSPDSTAEVSVPIDVYKIYCASGEIWYGQLLKFGVDTIYSQCEGTFDFYDDGEYYQGWTLELYEQTNGNMDTDIISAGDFPG